MKKLVSPLTLTPERVRELGRCSSSYIYFVNNYCKIYDSVDKEWIPFHLWDAQRKTLHAIHSNQLTVVLKARQLGITWIALSYALWLMLFRPISVISIFSRRDTESMYLMGQERMRGIYANLPPWMKTGHEALADSGHEWIMKTGSSVRAFSTNSGDGYVSSFAIVDEADLQPDLNKLMRSVKPTIDNGGKMMVLSRSNKSEPESEFKRLYRGARDEGNGWYPIFIPWNAHPGRDEEWYEAQRRDILSRTGSLDDLYEQYPATDDQALSSKSLDKRIPPLWIEACYSEVKPLTSVKGAPAINGLTMYQRALPGIRYVIGADPAEGNPNSDDSALTVVEVDSGDEVASFAGKYEPAIFASYIALVSAYYNNAAVLVERNNHGHSVIQWLEEHARKVRLLLGHDAETHKKDKRSKKRRKHLKAGWLSSTLGKTILYTVCAEYFRDNAQLEGLPNKILHTRTTYIQLSSIEAETLSAPKGQHDDRADSFALAQVGRGQVSALSHSAVLAMDSTSGWGL